MSENGLVFSYKIVQLTAQRKKSTHRFQVCHCTRISYHCGNNIRNGIDIEYQVRIIIQSHDTTQSKDLSSELKNYVEYFESRGSEIQIDESTDISRKAQLLSFNRFVKNNKFLNECLFWKDMMSTTNGKDIFEVVKQNISCFGLLLKCCVDVWIDGCPVHQSWET